MSAQWQRPRGGTRADRSDGRIADGHLLPATRRRMPPYLRRYAYRLRDGSATAWIVIGPESWRWARDRAGTRHIVIVCPPGDDPAAYDWTACAGHDPVLLVRAGPTDSEQMRAAIEALIRDGTDRVLDDAGALYVAREVAHAA